MNKPNILFIIDKIEFKYFEFNQLVTSFWMIKECLQRGWSVSITTPECLFLNGNKAGALAYKTKLVKLEENFDILKDDNYINTSLNDFNMILFRPDPPVDIDYINSTFILDYVDTSKTLVLNSPSGIRKANEKLYINNFSEFIPDNITTANAQLIKEFLEQHDEIVLKPLNRCFSKGVFYLKKGDKNLNTIIDTATNYGQTVIMAQKYLSKISEGDKRVLLLGGEVLEEAITKVSSEGDFKFNSHRDESFKKAELTTKDRALCKSIAPKLLEDGLYIVGLDVIDGYMIETNVTSPCFFIKEINQMYGVQLEVKIVDYLECCLLKHSPKLALLR